MTSCNRGSTALQRGAWAPHHVGCAEAVACGSVHNLMVLAMVSEGTLLPSSLRPRSWVMQLGPLCPQGVMGLLQLSQLSSYTSARSAAAQAKPNALQVVAAKIGASRALAQRLAEEKSAVGMATRASANGSLDEEELTQCDFEAEPIIKRIHGC